MFISWVAWLELEFTGTGYEYTLYTEIGRWKEDVGIFTAMYKWNVVLYTGNPQRSRKTVGPYWKLEIVGISLWWCFGLGLKMTLGHVTTGMEIVCYLTKSCIPNLIFSSSFSNCVGTLLMIKIHDPGHPLMHELIKNRNSILMILFYCS